MVGAAGAAAALYAAPSEVDASAEGAAGVGAGAEVEAAGVDAARVVVSEAAGAASGTSSIVTGRGPVDLARLSASFWSEVGSFASR